MYVIFVEDVGRFSAQSEKVEPWEKPCSVLVVRTLCTSAQAASDSNLGRGVGKLLSRGIHSGFIR
jgi:hypothetical protein